MPFFCLIKSIFTLFNTIIIYIRKLYLVFVNYIYNYLNNDYKKLIIEFQKELLIDRDKNTDDMEKLYHPVRILCDAVKKIIALMDEKNRESNSYSFFDVLHKSFDIITKLDGDGNFVLTRLGESLRKKYKFILIDEYQDTNAIQNALFNAISDNGKNLYCVGDVKQSIYRFRGAKVENILNGIRTISI